MHCLNVEYAELSDDVDTAYKSLDEFIGEVSASLVEHTRDLESAKKSKSRSRYFAIGSTVAGVTATVFMPYASVLAISLLGGGASGGWFYSQSRSEEEIESEMHVLGKVQAVLLEKQQLYSKILTRI